jgi:glyoxylase I family protein
MLTGTGSAVAKGTQSGERREAGRDRIAMIHHLALRSADIEALAAFYCEVFDLIVVRDSRPRSLWLGIGEESVLMIEARADAEPEIAAGSMELFALRTTEEGCRRIAERARERGCHDGETAWTVYLRDPEGRRCAASYYPLDCQAENTRR